MATAIDSATTLAGQSRLRWRSVARTAIACAVLVAFVFSIRPLTIQFHRLIRNGAGAAFVKLDGTVIPESDRYWFFYESEWHQDRLVRMGYLDRRAYRYRNMVYPLPASTSMLMELSRGISQDCDFAMGKDQITIWAPPHEIDRLIAIVEAHDVAPVVGGSNDTPSP